MAEGTKAKFLFVGFLLTGLFISLVLTPLLASAKPSPDRSKIVLAIADKKTQVAFVSQTLPNPQPQPPPPSLPHFNYSPKLDLLWTFDDCEDNPLQGIVASYINDLKKHNITKAIFFMTGNCYYSRPDLAQLIQVNGYTIGNHTKDHADLTKLTADKIDAEIKGGPPHTKYFRPPFGARNPLVDSRVKAAGLIMLIWGASGGDSGTQGLTRSCDRILEDLVHTTDPGDAVLLHMYNPNSPKAMEAYLSGKPSCEE